MDRILITGEHPTDSAHRFFPANTVRVLIGGETKEERIIPQLRGYTQTGENPLGGQGAIVFSPNRRGIQDAVEYFLSEYPHLSIQDNS